MKLNNLKCFSCPSCLSIPHMGFRKDIKKYVLVRGRHLLGGQAYCFNKMMSHFPIVLEQKTVVLQNNGGASTPPHPPLQVSATGFKEK